MVCIIQVCLRGACRKLPNNAAELDCVVEVSAAISSTLLHAATITRNSISSSSNDFGRRGSDLAQVQQKQLLQRKQKQWMSMPETAETAETNINCGNKQLMQHKRRSSMCKYRNRIR